MVATCTICGFRARRGSGIKLHRLPLRKPKALKCQLELLSIYKENIPVNRHTRICSQHLESRPRKKTTLAASHKSGATEKDNSKECGEETDDIKRETVGSTEDLLTLAEVCEEHKCSDIQILADASSQVDYLPTAINKEAQTENNFTFSIRVIIEDERKLKYFTGFVDTDMFWIYFRLITQNQIFRNRNSILSLEDQFLLVLLRLRLGITEQFIAHLFHISTSTVGKYFRAWINMMYKRFKALNIWPSREKIINTMPESVALKWPKLRVIIDCTEVKIPRPKNPIGQQLTFSNYKNYNSAKALVGISPTGAISFISELYGGAISDREIVKKSGLLEKLEPGDMLMADRGFTIEDITKPLGVELNLPDFTRKGQGQQLSPYEVAHSRRIAHVRVHVERAIGRIKEYKILTQINSTHLLPDLNKIFYICCILSNLHNELIK